MQPRIRTVTTASGATAVQIIYSYAGGATSMEHLGSAHTDAELAALKAEAARRLQGNQLELGLDLDVTDIPAVPRATVGGHRTTLRLPARRDRHRL